MTLLIEGSRTGESEMHAMKKKTEPDVVRSFIYWENPPEPGQDLHDIAWGVMEVLSDKTMRFVKTDPDPEELEKLIKSLKDQML
jgi:hypothetical protein